MPASRGKCQFPTKIRKCDKLISVRKTAESFTGGFPRQTEAKIYKPKAKVSTFPLSVFMLNTNANTGNNSGLFQVILIFKPDWKITFHALAPSSWAGRRKGHTSCGESRGARQSHRSGHIHFLTQPYKAHHPPLPLHLLFIVYLYYVTAII